MLQEQASIERQGYKVHFRSYSDKVYGYRIMLNDEPHFIINERLMGDTAIETLYRLIDASDEYAEYGFVLLQKDNKLYVDADYKFSKLMNRFVHNDSGKIVNFDKYKFTLGHGVEKYKDRWDL